MSDALIVQQSAVPAQQLVLLCHGVGGSARDMLPLALKLAAEFPTAWVVALDGLQPFDGGLGRQWFSIQGVTEENRGERVAAVLPEFVGLVRHWQQRSGADVEATALIGFSQGGIMALEAAHATDALAGRVVAIAGRFARLPEKSCAVATVHLIHGKSDPVIPYAHTLAAAERLLALGGDVTADVLPFVGHGIDDEVADLLIERLRGYLPRRRWEEALRDDAES